MDGGRNSRHGGLGDLHSGPVQVLLQTGIELCETTEFEIGDALLLVLHVTARSELVRRHFAGGGGANVRRINSRKVGGKRADAR